jgi:adenylate cyclase
VPKAGERLRITAQRIDPLTGRHLWSERFDRDETELFNLQDEIADRIVVALQLALTEGEQIHVWRSHSPNLEAWRQVANGVELFYRFNRVANAQAREAFTMAVEIDRTFALAHALIAWTNSLAAQCAWQDRATSFQRATELAWAALALDDTLPDVHVLLGPIHLPQGETSGGR